MPACAPPRTRLVRGPAAFTRSRSRSCSRRGRCSALAVAAAAAAAMAPRQAAALFSSVSYKAGSGAETTIGCMTADYSTTPDAAGSSGFKELVASSRITFCSYLSSARSYAVHIPATQDFTGKVVYVQRSNCDPAAVAAMLTYFGAVGVVIGNIYDGEISWPLSFSPGYFYVYLDYEVAGQSYVAYASTSDFADSNGDYPITVCLTDSDAAAVLEAALDTSSITMDMSDIVDNDGWSIAPQYTNTVVRFDWTVTTTTGAGSTSVVSSKTAAYSSPASQALFNVPGSASMTSTVVEVTVAPACKDLVYYSDCLDCWAAESPFANAADLAGNIAFITAETVADLSCYYFYYEVKGPWDRPRQSVCQSVSHVSRASGSQGVKPAVGLCTRSSPSTCGVERKLRMLARESLGFQK
jgi:hypothetical protein